MNIKELLNTRLDYCLMKQNCKKHRSAFYNFKVKQYTFLLEIYNKGSLEEGLQTAKMSVDYLEEMYEDKLNNYQYELEVLGKKEKDIEELDKIKHKIQLNKSFIKAYNFLLQLEDFYEASYWDLPIAIEWDRFCQFGRI